MLIGKNGKPKNDNHNKRTATRTLGGLKAMPVSIRIAGALAAPLLLGACGLPIGIQIASLVADGVSYATTEKTLADHGLSAITRKDCALWRGIEGENICREPGGDDAQTALADASASPDDDIQLQQPAPAATNQTAPEFPTEDDVEKAAERKIVVPAPLETGPVETAEVRPLDAERMILGAAGTGSPEAEPGPLEAPMALEPIRTEVVRAPVPAPPPAAPAAPPSRAERVIAKREVPRPPEAEATPTEEIGKKTYYIIASYRRATDARRFSSGQGRWKPSIIKGTAKGRRVFRVAVGPIAHAERKATRARLLESGFTDTWKLTLKAPDVMTELASLN